MTTVKQLKQSIQSLIDIMRDLPDDEVVDMFQVDSGGFTVEIIPWGDKPAPIQFSMLSRDGSVAGAALSGLYSIPADYDEIRENNEGSGGETCPNRCAVEELSVVVVRRGPSEPAARPQ